MNDRITRRAALALPVGVAAAPLLPRAGTAQGRAPWPDGPIRFLQGFAAGGTTDIVARLIAPPLAAALGRPVVVENRPGAGGTLAAEALAHARDGHTIMLINNGFAVSAALYRKLPYDPRADIEPVAMVASVALVLLGRTGPAAPRDLAELVRRAREAPERLNVATVGAGSTQHLVAEAVQASAGIRLTHVPYRSTSAAMIALRNGEVELVVEPASSVLGQLQANEARALAVTTASRSPLLPEVPTVAEQLGLPGFNIETWYAVAVPAGTPPEVSARLAAATRDALADPALRDRLAGLGLAPRLAAPAEARAQVLGEIDRWTRTIEAAGIERQ